MTGIGAREVHGNTPEGRWRGPRDFPRPFRVVDKASQHRYVAMFGWGDNAKLATPSFLRALLGVGAPTTCLT